MTPFLSHLVFLQVLPWFLLLTTNKLKWKRFEVLCKVLGGLEGKYSVHLINMRGSNSADTNLPSSSQETGNIYIFFILPGQESWVPSESSSGSLAWLCIHVYHRNKRVAGVLLFMHCPRKLLLSRGHPLPADGWSLSDSVAMERDGIRCVFQACVLPLGL